MASTKGPIYSEKNTIGNKELLDQLKQAVLILEERMKATLPIKKGNTSPSGFITIGFGVDKVNRGIAADAVVSIAKTIKSSKGW